MEKVCSRECFERGVEAVKTEEGKERVEEPKGERVRGGVEAESGRTAAVCKICFKEFVVSSPAPHPAHTSEVIDFCSPECKSTWINQEQEWDFGRNIPDDCLFCMHCAMVPVHPIPLPCSPERHVFCSLECVAGFIREEMGRVHGDAGRIACPSCQAPIPREILEGWGIGQAGGAPVRQPASLHLRLQPSSCHLCHAPGPLRPLECHHTLCQQCVTQNTLFGSFHCPICPQ